MAERYLPPERVDEYLEYERSQLGEHAWFAEMAGTVLMRDFTLAPAGPLLNPPVLSASLGNVNATGQVNKSGYLYAIFLPDLAGPGAGIGENAAGGSPGGGLCGAGGFCPARPCARAAATRSFRCRSKRISSTRNCARWRGVRI